MKSHLSVNRVFVLPLFWLLLFTFSFQVKSFGQLVPATISPETQNVNTPSGSIPNMPQQNLQVSTSPSGGQVLPYAYQWEAANTPYGPFDPIETATSTVYNFIINGRAIGVGEQTTYYRLKISSGTEVIYSNIAVIHVLAPNAELRNDHIREHTVLVRSKTTFKQVNQLPVGQKTVQTNYFYHGRVIQTVDQEVSYDAATNSWKDMVTHHQYDAIGRKPLEFLPYPDASNIGRFKDNVATNQAGYYQQNFSETHPNGRVVYESSPLSRITNSYAPGTNWGAANAGNSFVYDVNNSNEEENIHVWNITDAPNSIPVSGVNDVYTVGKLSKIISTDEKGIKVIEYKDFSGNIILKKVQDKNPGNGLTPQHAGWACTYYVYDDFNKLRFIIPPKAVEWLDVNSWNLASNVDIVNELCFWNEYDKLGRVIRKKSPGAAVLEMVYDIRNRLVFSRNAKQRAEDKWLVNLYDNLDRNILTGIITYAGITQHQLQTMVDGVMNNGTNQPFFVNTDKFTIHELQVNANPISNNNTLYTLTINYYDQYNFPYAPSFNTNFLTDNSLAADEFEPVVPGKITTGYITGSYTRILTSVTKFLQTVNFYDEKGRLIQVQAENIKGNFDIVTTQYDFAGKVRSTYTTHQATIAQTTAPVNIFNKSTFDKIGRVIKITETINANNPKDLAEYTYNELGQMKKKRLAPGFGGTDGPELETIDYDYNIRGWLTGMNKNYANSIYQDGRYFGMEIGYDKTGTNFLKPELNGNITGITWKSRGDNYQRKYDYYYDNRNQLSVAAFKQKNTAGGAFTNDKVDASTWIYYDINGNITQQIQTGIVPGFGPNNVDHLNYYYDKNGFSNRLIRIDENAAGSWNGKLGDFKNGSNAAGTNDYVYDADGNLTKDFNKEMENNTGADGIEYNILGMPSKVWFKNTNKTITYTYDAAGNKLSKRVEEPAQNSIPATDVTTDYVLDFIYNNGSLEFFSHTEGRIRIITPYTSPSIHPDKPVDNNYLFGGIKLPGNKEGVYDYYIKDHLGSLRMILTEEQHQVHATATMEIANPAVQNQEEAIFGQQGADNEVAATRNNKPPGWTSNSSEKASRLSTLGFDKKIGPNSLLRVMAGDFVSSTANYYYDNYDLPPPASNILNDILASLLGGINSNRATSFIKSNAAQIQNNLLNSSNFTGFLQKQQNTGKTRQPKAFLTVLFFDEQFNFVEERSGYARVEANGQVVPPKGGGAPRSRYLSLVMQAPKNGYAMVYLSNETDHHVYFDDLQVTHTRGRIIEENHYYAYGLKIAGISSKAMPSGLGGARQNSRANYGFQSNFSEEDMDAQWNEFDLRTYDPQIGRWLQIDPYDEFASGYLGMGNNPVYFIDPTGGSVFFDWIRVGNRLVNDPLVNGAGDLGLVKSIYGENIEYIGKELPSEYWTGFLRGIYEMGYPRILQMSEVVVTGIKYNKSVDYGLGSVANGNRTIPDWIMNPNGAARFANETANPLWWVYKGGIELYTGRDYDTNRPKDRVQTATDLGVQGITAAAGGRVATAATGGLSSSSTVVVSSATKTGGMYIPKTPLAKQKVAGWDIPLPDPLAGKFPHTTLGGKIGSDGILYRQSATFSGGSWPLANGKIVPWSRVDWTTHGRPLVHPNPHQHIFNFNNGKNWEYGKAVPFP